MDYGQTSYRNNSKDNLQKPHSYSNQPRRPAGCTADLEEVSLFLLTAQGAKRLHNTWKWLRLDE